jgi:hypothetical protein
MCSKRKSAVTEHRQKFGSPTHLLASCKGIVSLDLGGFLMGSLDKYNVLDIAAAYFFLFESRRLKG